MIYNSKPSTAMAEKTEASVIKLKPSRVLKSNDSIGPPESGWGSISRMAKVDLRVPVLVGETGRRGKGSAQDWHRSQTINCVACTVRPWTCSRQAYQDNKMKLTPGDSANLSYTTWVTYLFLTKWKSLSGSRSLMTMSK